MERDFLGINAQPKLESPPPRDDGRGSNPNSAIYGNAASQWPFTNKEEPQHFLSFAKRQEGQSSHFSQPTFQPQTPKRAHVLATHRLLQCQSTPQYVSESVVPNVNLRPSGSASSSLSPKTSPFVGIYQAREVPKSFPSQLTIFYGGSVVVFDNVPLDKAREIMSLANKASSTPVTPNPISEQRTKALSKSASFSGGIVITPKPKPAQKPEQVMEPLLPPMSVSTEISLTPQVPARSSSISAVTNESVTTGPHSDAPVTTTTKVPTAVPTSRAIPQARKASLARFLQMRKERVIAAMPYPCTTKSSEDLTTKSSSADLTLSSNSDESLRAGPSKTKISNEEYFNTKLEI